MCYICMLCAALAPLLIAFPFALNSPSMSAFRIVNQCIVRESSWANSFRAFMCAHLYGLDWMFIGGWSHALVNGKRSALGNWKEARAERFEHNENVIFGARGRTSCCTVVTALGWPVCVLIRTFSMA